MTDLATAWGIEVSRGLVRGGVKAAWICPGSRSTPLALAADAHPAIATRVTVDERSAAFQALGAAKASGRPVAVITTSGTAVAELLPAVVEAHQANVPLLLVTADRPQELRDTGANQTIDQTRIFAPYARWEQDLPAPSEAALAGTATSVAEGVAASWIHPAGPVHLNVPLRKPLEPNAEGIEALQRLAGEPQTAQAGRPGILEDTNALPDLTAPRGLIVVGPRAPDGLRARFMELADRLGVPVIADGLSGLRFGPGSKAAVCFHDLFLSDAGLHGRLRPDWILQAGASPTSKHLRAFLARHGTPRYRIDESGRRWDDIPGRVRILTGGAEAVLDGLQSSAGPCRDTQARKRWHGAWRAMDEDAHSALTRLRSGAPDAETSTIPAVLETAGHLFVGNSLPVRDLERFAAPSDQEVAVWANRGASGIDGTIATPSGIAQMAGPTTAVIGDVAFQHDVGSLAGMAEDLRLVVIDNGGGRIFQHLPIASHARFDDLFLTRPTVDIGKACAAFGIDHDLVEGDPDAVRTALQGTAQVVQVRTDGDAALAFRRRAAQEAAVAVREAVQPYLQAQT